MSSLQLKDAGSEVLIIGAHTQESFPMQGTFVQCLESDGELRMSMNNGSKMKFSAGLGRITNDGVEFTSIQLFNDTNDEIIVEVGYGDIRDQRLQATGNTPVTNPSGQKLQVQDSSVYGRVSDVLTYIYDGTSLKKGVSGWNGVGVLNASRSTAGTTTLVSSGANLNGIKIHKASVRGYGSIYYSGNVKIGGNVVVGTDVAGALAQSTALEVIENILLPAGQSLTMEVGAGGTDSASVNVWYEVL